MKLFKFKLKLSSQNLNFVFNRRFCIPLLIISSLSISNLAQSERSSFFDSVYDITTPTTGSVIGHAPGIRSAASINREDGVLRVCSKVKIHYQILDKDGDWDRPFEAEFKEGTQNSITWWFKSKDGVENIQVDKRSLGIDPDSKVDQTWITIPKYLKNAITDEYVSTEGGELWYQIQPYTELATSPDTSDSPLFVYNLNKAYYLELADSPGFNIKQNQFEKELDFIFEPFLISNPNDLSLNVNVPGLILQSDQYVIKNTQIHESDCEENPDEFEVTFYNQDDEIVDGYFHVDSEYKAIIKLGGRPLTKGDLIDSQIIWNLYKPLDGARCDISIEEDRKNTDCFNHAEYKENDKFEEGGERIVNSYDQFDNLLFSKFLTQRNNNDAKDILRQTKPNYSEQGYFITVSLVPKDFN